jgi:predicted DCC family thiol-disulfide oxidoreductase YuxK
MGATPSVTNWDGAVIFFDGECNLCSGAIKFILKRDQKGYFKFASLQSVYARNHLKKFGMDNRYETIVLLLDNKVFLKSDAALEIARRMDFPWTILYALKIFPKALRNSVYDLIARHRYRWFGKSDQCMIPTSDITERFVE